MLVQTHPLIGSRVKRTPYGRCVDLPPDFPSSDWATLRKTSPWWKDSKYRVGTLTKKTRKIKIMNMLTHQQTILEVSFPLSKRFI